MRLPWFHLYWDIARHPKALHLCSLLSVERAHRLVVDLWCWAADKAPTGDLSAFADGVLATAGGWQGDPSAFVAALRTAGWLDPDGFIHDWDLINPELVRVGEEAGDREASTLARQTAGAPKSRNPDRRGLTSTERSRRRRALLCNGKPLHATDATACNGDATVNKPLHATDATVSPGPPSKDKEQEKEEKYTKTGCASATDATGNATGNATADATGNGVAPVARRVDKAPSLPADRAPAVAAWHGRHPSSQVGAWIGMPHGQSSPECQGVLEGLWRLWDTSCQTGALFASDRVYSAMVHGDALAALLRKPPFSEQPDPAEALRMAIRAFAADPIRAGQGRERNRNWPALMKAGNLPAALGQALAAAKGTDPHALPPRGPAALAAPSVQRVPDAVRPNTHDASPEEIRRVLATMPRPSFAPLPPAPRPVIARPEREPKTEEQLAERRALLHAQGATLAAREVTGG